MRVPLVLFLSAIVLHSASAGGAYCAKTARARAAALGWDYPGVHGAPDLSGPAHHELYPRKLPLRPQHYMNYDHESAESGPNIASYTQIQPGVRSFDNSMQRQAHPSRTESTFPLIYGNPVQSEYTTDQMLSLPRGQSLINHKSNFEEVKHVAFPALAEAPGQPDLANWNPQGRNKPLSFVYNERDLVFDESVPDRRGMSLSGLPQPRSRGHGTYQRRLAGYGLGREAPVLGSSHFANKVHVRAMTNQGPAVSGLRRIRFPGRPAQPLHTGLHVQRFVQGNPVLG